MTSTNRYSDAELEEFRVLIQTKLDTAKNQLEQLQSQIFEITENSDDEYGSDWMDDSSINNEIEILNDMAIRQRKYIQDLENALVRIRNKTYGICVVTGELIDKKRLLAVPTTTKSIAAKNAEQVKVQPQKPASSSEGRDMDSDDSDIADTPPPPKKSRPTTPIIIDKVIRKSPTGNAPKKPAVKSDDDDDDFDLYKDLEIEDDDEVYPDSMIDPDTISDEEDREDDF
ncbi:MAG: TraR/DksA family transcriptional regulator [Lewinellaceae bacterium]|nr:TraR/DksA family transcriptional regulator [Lewinellaceae bacterium]